MKLKHVLIVLLYVTLFGQLKAEENRFKISGANLEISFEIVADQKLKQRLILPRDYNGSTALPGPITESDLEVSLHCSGENKATFHGAKLCGGMPGLRLTFTKMDKTAMPWGTRYVIFQQDSKLNLQVDSYYDFYEHTNTCRRYTKVCNNSSNNISIDYLSSAMINNVGNLGQGGIEEKLVIHWAHNSYCAEGQWHTQRPSEKGWAANGAFQLSGIFHNNLGSMSTIKELPMAMIENKAVGLTWFWQIEHNGSWHWEFSNVVGRSGHPYTETTPTYIYIGGPDEEHHHAWKSLKPGEVYETVPVAIGCVVGGFDETVAALTKYRRAACLRPHRDNVNCPVIFNDYMNCLFGDPTTEKELPLIDAAANAGCDYFVVDAGWYAERNEKWWDAVGLWQPGITRFPGGIEEVMNYIRKKKMVPGLWLEIERAGINSPLKTKSDDWFFMRHGQRVIHNSSYLLDFRNPEVIAYADEVVNRVVGTYGADYIKMDYNVNALMGTEAGTSSIGQGLLEHQRAYRDWMLDVYDRHNDLVIENCGSGGCRMDYAMLSMHQIQSSSDQKDYRKYPSIVVGAMAAVLPEQLAVWSYPMKDGDRYEASFNMVNAMMGRIHQSGHLAELPEESFVQVQNGIKIYKEEMARKIPHSIPFFPLGMPSIADRNSPVALGLEHPDAYYYAVWRLAGDGVVRLDLKNKGHTEILYPVDLGIQLVQGEGVITISFPKQYMAVIIKVNK